MTREQIIELLNIKIKEAIDHLNYLDNVLIKIQDMYKYDNW